MPLDLVNLNTIVSGKEESLKNAIIQILSEEWPLTAKQIFQKAKKDFGKEVSYQAIHKTVRGLIAKKVLVEKKRAYLLNIDWLQNLDLFTTLTLEKYLESGVANASKTKVYNCKMSVYDNPDMFYKLMLPLLRKEHEIRFSSKSPSLIISKEGKKTPARKAYVEELKKAIERGAKIKYLIAGDLTKSLVGKYKDKSAVESLKFFSNTKNTKIKCTSTKAIMSYAVCKNDFFINPTAINHFAPVAVIHFRGPDMTPIHRVFDIIFAEADECDDLIKEIENDVSKKSKKKVS